MPTLTAKQRLQALVDAFGAREGLRRLLALDGVAAPAAGQGAPDKPLTNLTVPLPTWLTAQRAEAIVAHFLHGELLLPWHVAPFWQDQWVAQGWPMVGAAMTTPGWQPASAAPPSAGAAPWSSSPALEPIASEVGATTPAVATSHSVPPQLWATLVDLYGDTVWLWTKYRKYFLPVAGKPALLAGVLLPHEVGQGTITLPLHHAQTSAPKAKGASVQVDCFAYTLAVGIGVLESHDFATFHNVVPIGYPSQWQAPEPPTTTWASPLHGDERFWHEFDEPPTGDKRRFVRQGLTRQEAVRVWARRVAICLWGDANGHWGRWPWRLETTSLGMRRRLLGWDPQDERAIATDTNFAATKDGSSRFGFQNSAAITASSEPELGRWDAFGQLLFPIAPTGLGASRESLARFEGLALWDSNPYLAWLAAWHEWEGNQVAPAAADLKASGLAAHWVASKFQRMGIWHGIGYIDGGKASGWKIGLRKFRARSPTGSNTVVRRLDEVLDLNMGGCHTNAAVAVALLRSQCIPAVVSEDLFFGYGRSTKNQAVPGTAGEARSVPPSSLGTDGDTKLLVGGHKSVMLGLNELEWVVPHSDRLLSDRLGAFADPDAVWLPFPEHLLSLLGLGEAGYHLKGWVQACIAEHERRRARSSLLRAGATWASRRVAAATFDSDRIDRISPFASPRLSWFLVAERTLSTNLVRGLKGGPWLVQAAQSLAQETGPNSKPESSLPDGVSVDEMRRLVAILLGIDSSYVWFDELGLTMTSALTGWGLAGSAKYVTGAHFPSNFQMTGSTGQFPYNYESAAGLLSSDPAIYFACAAFVQSLLWE